MPGIKALAIAVFACALAAYPAAAQVTVTPTETVAARLIAAHNAERARLGLKPLTWSAKLADHAKSWAQTLATSEMFEHAPVGADGGEGENLWTGTRSDYSTEEMVAFWIAESSLFKRGKFPDVVTKGRWEDVGHYTQVVWKDTREVGCAIASNPRSDYLVCRYLPAGNIVGEPVYDYKAAAAIPIAAPVMAPGANEVEIETTLDETPAPRTHAPVSPSKPKKRASQKHRRGG